jgi:hypothetical protein
MLFAGGADGRGRRWLAAQSLFTIVAHLNKYNNNNVLKIHDRLALRHIRIRAFHFSRAGMTNKTERFAGFSFPG